MTKFPKKILAVGRFKVKVECDRCQNVMYIMARKHDDGTMWLEGRCCRGHTYRNFDIDYLQPTNPFYSLLYKNSDDEYNRKKRVAKIEEEQRKAKIEEKYFYQFMGNNPNSVVRTETKKALEKEVLKRGE